VRVILLCVLFLATLGTTLYQVKTGIDVRESRLQSLQKQIDQTRREIAVLEAEWAFLSRPERVMDLSDRLLGMQPIAQDRILPIEAIPMRAIPEFNETNLVPGQMEPVDKEQAPAPALLTKTTTSQRGGR